MNGQDRIRISSNTKHEKDARTREKSVDSRVMRAQTLVSIYLSVGPAVCLATRGEIGQVGGCGGFEGVIGDTSYHAGAIRCVTRQTRYGMCAARARETQIVLEILW